LVLSVSQEEIKKLSVETDQSILDAIKKMDELKKKLLLVTRDSPFPSLLRLGDIQTAILRAVALESPIADILRENIRVAHINDAFDEIKARMLRFRMEMLPALDDEGRLQKLYTWNEIFGETYRRYQGDLNAPVVVMAGGKGTRLKPITNIIPKALIPIEEKPIIEVIMDKFRLMGSRQFYLSINYKGDMIRHYFEQEKRDYSIDYIQEEKPLGTAGSLHMLKGRLQETFFVTNCDIIIEEDYEEIYRYHKREQNELTLVAALKHYPIPYGILETWEQGQLTGITEKPELTFQVNSGMYLLEANLLDEIPDNEFFHITQLIDKVMARGGKVGVFPVSEGSWMDVGVWSEYNRTRHLFQQDSIEL